MNKFKRLLYIIWYNNWNWNIDRLFKKRIYARKSVYDIEFNDKKNIIYYYRETTKFKNFIDNLPSILAIILITIHEIITVLFFYVFCTIISIIKFVYKLFSTKWKNFY